MLLFISDDERSFLERFGIREFKVKSLLYAAAKEIEGGSLDEFLSSFSVAIIDEFATSANPVDVLRAIRRACETPVMWVSQSPEVTECVVALELGADDFVREPVDRREFAARIRALTRRPSLACSKQSKSRLVADDVELLVAERLVFLAGDSLKLSRVEFDMLHLLLKHRGSVVTRDQISSEVFGSRTKTRHRSIDVHMSCLRKKLGNRTDGGDRIRTIHGLGYIYAFAAR